MRSFLIRRNVLTVDDLAKLDVTTLIMEKGVGFKTYKEALDLVTLAREMVQGGVMPKKSQMEAKVDAMLEAAEKKLADMEADLRVIENTVGAVRAEVEILRNLQKNVKGGGDGK